MSSVNKPCHTAFDSSTQEAFIELEGSVCSGLGEGSKFTQMHWVLKEFINKLGLKPFPGTFNLAMSGVQWEQGLIHLQKVAGIRIDPPDGFCSAKCFRVVLQGQVEGVAILPAVSEYPRDKFEVVAAVSIRQVLQLEDGAPVKVQLYLC